MLCRLEVLALLVVAFALPASGVAQAAQPAPASSALSAVQANPAPHPAPGQPLPYSHKTHVGMGVACQLCHVNPEPGKEMTFPNTATCMSCHATLVTDRPAIQKLAEYAHSTQPIPWVRVYKLLPGVTWSHRKHLEAGVPCETCHGAVGNLEVMSETTAITGMASCISCHQAHKVSAACNVCHSWPAK